MDSSASTHPNRRVRVFGINDSPVFLDALKRFFLLEPWVDLVGTAVMTAGVFQAVSDAQPDVIILEPARHRATLPNIIAQLRARLPQVGIVVLTMDPGPHAHDPGLKVAAVDPDWAAAAGADAFVAKEHAAEDLLEAIRRVSRHP